MINRKKVAALILARAGSKALKNKNIINLNGKPLIYYTINILKKVKYINKVYVITDSKKIAKVAEKYGAEIPFLRQKKFSSDHTTSEETLKYALNKLIDDNIYNPDAIVYSQLTEPFKTSKIIARAVTLYLKSKVDTVFVAKPYKKNVWYKKNKNDLPVRLNNFEKYGIPRQLKRKLFREDTGVCCISSKKVILSGRRIGKKCKILEYENPFDYVDIHNKYDLKIANFILQNNLFKIS